MGIGPIRGGGNRSGAKSAGKASSAAGKGAVGKAGGSTPGKVDQTSGLVGPSGLAGSSEVGSPGVSGQMVVEEAKAIAKALKSGEIATRAEAAKKLVATILKERMAVQSKALEARIAEQLIDDPRLQQTLERIWQKGA